MNRHKAGRACTVLVVLFTIGCSKSVETAEAATEEFRRRCARGAFSDIFLDAAPEFQKSANERDFVKLMDNVREQLGNCQSSKRSAWQAFAGTGGQAVTLIYNSEFERGTATEEFVWRIRGEATVLLGYHISSPTLRHQMIDVFTDL